MNPEQPIQTDEWRAPRLAQAFADKAMDAYDQLLVGETDAKMMYLALLVMGGKNGMGGVLLGPPGTGKSRLLKYGHQVVGGIEDEHVALVPHRADLTGAQLVGEESEMERRHTTDTGATTIDTFSASLKPILHRGIKAVKFDELNRTSPLALNAALDILQEGGVKVFENGRPVEATEFDLVVSSMNNYGTIFTNKQDPALLNRTAMGAFMGDRSEGELSQAGETIWDKDDDHESKPDISQIIHLKGLHIIREGINEMFIDAPAREMGKRLTVGALDVFAEEGIESGDGRISAQMKRIARTLALLTGQSKVTDNNLLDASRYAMTARVADDRKPIQVDKLVDDARSRAE